MIDNNEVMSTLCAETHSVNGNCVTLTGVVVHEGHGCDGCLFYLGE